MPGVLVDDPSFSVDPLSHALLLESLSCSSPLFHPSAAPSSPSYIRPSFAHCIPAFSRCFGNPSSGDVAFPQFSQPRETLDQRLESLRRSAAMGGEFGAAAAEDFSMDPFAGDQARNSTELLFGGLPGGSLEAAAAAAQFATMNGGSKAGGSSLEAQFASMNAGGIKYGSGNEVEEQGAASPFASARWGSTTSSGSSRSSNGGGVGSPAPAPEAMQAMLALQKFLPSNLEDEEGGAWPAVDVYSCDEFRMFEFKVRRCMRGRSHDWTECPFAHPGEKARRRDPRRFHYSGTACPDFRKGNCKRGDVCEFAHGVFECWLHPARYRTQPCKDGRNCKRRVCFFAHTPEQLRLLPSAQAANASSPRLNPSSPPLKSKLASYDGSSLRCAMAAAAGGAAASPSSAAAAAAFVDSSVISSGDGASSFHRFGAFSNGDSSVLCSGDGAASFHRFGAFGNSSNGSSSRSFVSSPTSTLIGLSVSPPSLSPPLSPSVSPPGSPVDWSSRFAHSPSCLAPPPLPGTPPSPLARNCNVSQLHASFGQSLHAVQGQAGVPVHRRHLDRLNLSLSLSIPVDQRGSFSALSSPTSACHAQSATPVEDLADLLQKLEMTGHEPYWLQQQAQAATMVQPRFSSGPSPLRRSSQSVPGTPTKMKWKGADADLWNLNEKELEPTLERVESGRGLRAKIFESLMMGSQPGRTDDPDVNWVNDLVQEQCH